MNPNITIRPFTWEDLTPLAQCYARGRIWADEPWNEWKKCPQCPTDKNNFGISFKGKSCPYCGKELIPFWDVSTVENDIKTQLGKPFAKGFLACKNNQILGFTWGYPVTINIQIIIPDLELTIPIGSSLINTQIHIPMYAGKVGYIDEVGVRSDFRRQGIAEALTLEVLCHFSSCCINKVFLRTDERASNAVRLYEKLGFQRDFFITDPTYEHRGYWSTDVTGLYYERVTMHNDSATPKTLQQKNLIIPIGGGWEH
ncbi:hypothetical protein A2X44_01615 [candidate division CPR3 bacterium GWF2_35_18]|uniref:Mycothiol acetyltransferase n=1 Tax=candidate division CPR3 bacterium GW2011_GWF2_35_18 TaxID=1618350 RepID=A0A0G0ERE1_UNCC3|nr:MAG: Mycothiol acetyltransferase [candidate division CPR3 bacterium GW2011_GWF2_35_18]OGB62699.1 MAG: hypothetical protein A2X44_01615 [candidate division CPR3 bacterium GWF2_35_18]OGB65725.1 MAG: hypothetical protein A2250_01875 [candidate division CPR3 bacterium RIFOXYA2_FULL_35_13]OGB76236.1 MAG: hypothetical protein A2476_02220 [candidate division CPR3 bacterium RIFOXYC2_FULL_35_7]OGB78688.1 MAG: hypothetical protein A2296_05425 [candidate division CPR3 bacterium RIFOXYB2_FULL_35_8]